MDHRTRDVFRVRNVDERIKHSGHFEGPKSAVRRLTDPSWAVFIILYTILTIVALVYGFLNGDLASLGRPVNAANVTCTPGQPGADRPYLFWPLPAQNASSLCVSECPASGTVVSVCPSTGVQVDVSHDGAGQPTPLSDCDDAAAQDIDVVYPTSAVLHRCLPTAAALADPLVVSLFDDFMRPDFTYALAESTAVVAPWSGLWHVAVSVLLMDLILAIVYKIASAKQECKFRRLFAVSLAAAVAIPLIVATAVWFFPGKVVWAHANVRTPQLAYVQDYHWAARLIVSSTLLITWVWALWVLLQRAYFDVNLRLLAYGENLMARAPSLWRVVAGTVIAAQVVVPLLAAPAVLFLYSATRFERTSLVSTAWTCVVGLLLMLTGVYFWILQQFAVAFVRTIVSLVVSWWYFCRGVDGSLPPNLVVWEGSEILKYHFGTLVATPVLLCVLGPMQFMAVLFKTPRQLASRMIFALETDTIYAPLAVHGQDLTVSVRFAAALLHRNLGMLHETHHICSRWLVAPKAAAAWLGAAVYLSVQFVLTTFASSGAEVHLVPMLMVSVIGWLTVSPIASALDQAVDTALYCFCEDAERNNDTVMRPLHLPMELKDILEEASAISRRFHFKGKEVDGGVADRGIKLEEWLNKGRLERARQGQGGEAGGTEGPQEAPSRAWPSRESGTMFSYNKVVPADSSASDAVPRNSA